MNAICSIGVNTNLLLFPKKYFGRESAIWEEISKKILHYILSSPMAYIKCDK